MRAGRGVVKRRPARLIDLGAAIEQQPRAVEVALERRHHQRGFANAVLGINLGTLSKQQLHHVKVAVSRGTIQCSHAVVGFGVDVAVGLEDESGEAGTVSSGEDATVQVGTEEGSTVCTGVFSAEEKIKIVLEGMRGEDSIAGICRRYGIHQNNYFNWRRWRFICIPNRFRWLSRWLYPF